MANPANIKSGIKRRKAIVRYIQQYTKRNGFPPTHQEIGDHLGVSKTAIRHHLIILQHDGEISRQPGTSRSVRVRGIRV